MSLILDGNVRRNALEETYRTLLHFYSFFFFVEFIHLGTTSWSGK